MEDEVLEFNYRNPKKKHISGCTCIHCYPNRGRGVGEGKKIKITIPKIAIPPIVFNGENAAIRLDMPPEQKKAKPASYIHNGVPHLTPNL